MDNTIVNQGFYKLNNKILKFNISKNKEEILFNHYIMQKENIQRIKNELPKGQFYLTIRTVCNDLEVTYGKARHLINTFEKLDIITLVKAGGKNRTPSIYLYNSKQTIKLTSRLIPPKPKSIKNKTKRNGSTDPFLLSVALSVCCR